MRQVTAFSALSLYVVLLATAVYLLPPDAHHPDGISLAGYACTLSFEGVDRISQNGLALALYEPLINCDSYTEPSLPVGILNGVLLLFTFWLTLRSVRYQLATTLFLAIGSSFFIYSIFFPSKEIILAWLLTSASVVKSRAVAGVALAAISAIRPIYALLFLAALFKSRVLRLMLIGTCLLAWYAVHVTYAAEIAATSELASIYLDKADEYQGRLKDVFERLGVLAPAFQMIWNYFGIVGAAYTIVGGGDPHIWYSTGTLFALLLLAPSFIVKLFRTRLEFSEALIVAYVVATAAYPFPHSRYLYPLLFASWIMRRKDALWTSR